MWGVATVDMRVQHILMQIKSRSTEILANRLSGIYVHGSLALECFNWNKSDVDFIILTKSIPTLQQKEALIKTLLAIDNIAPQKGLEMSLVLEKYARCFVYPTPFELHFSNTYKVECLHDLEGYCRRMNGVDKDLAAHFTMIRNACITLCGASEKEIFGEVPAADYLDSIKNDVENAEKEIMVDPVYVILNLCRVLAFIQEKLVLSKKDGGIWGMEHLPTRYTKIVGNAISNYINNDMFAYKEDDKSLKDFAEYMYIRIFA